MTGTAARALAEGQTYCELTAQQASIKSLPVRAPALRAAVDKSTEGHVWHVFSESPSCPTRTSPVEGFRHDSLCTNRCSRWCRAARGGCCLSCDRCQGRW